MGACVLFIGIETRFLTLYCVCVCVYNYKYISVFFCILDLFIHFLFCAHSPVSHRHWLRRANLMSYVYDGELFIAAHTLPFGSCSCGRSPISLAVVVVIVVILRRRFEWIFVVVFCSQKHNSIDESDKLIVNHKIVTVDCRMTKWLVNNFVLKIWNKIDPTALQLTCPFDVVGRSN